MVNLVNKLISLGGDIDPIVAFEVAFLTPFGLVMDLETALAVCKENDFDPKLNIRPVCIARGKTLYEVI